MRVPKELTHLDQSAADAFVKKHKLAPRLKPWSTGSMANGIFVASGNVALKKLRLDHLDDSRAFIGEASGVIIDGNLTVDVLENGEQDFGPFLVVLGTLKVEYAAVAGAPIYVGKDLHIGHAFHGYYNHGYLTVDGKTRGGVLLADDYNAVLKGPITSKVSSRWGYVKGKVPKEPALDKLLAPKFVERDEDGDARMNGGAIYKALAAGKPILRAR